MHRQLWICKLIVGMIVYDCNVVHTEDVDMAADSKCSYEMTESVNGNVSFVSMFWAVKELL